MGPPDPCGRIAELTAETERVHSALRRTLHELARARAAYFRGGKTADAHAEMERLEKQSEELGERLRLIGEELQVLGGISDEMIEALEDHSSTLDERPRLERKSLSHETMAPTAMLEDFLPKAWENVRGLVDARWLEAERNHAWRLDDNFPSGPLSLTRGLRRTSEERSIHRFAQALLVTEDFLNKHEQYDHFAGALLVPQLVALGRALEVLKDVPGNTANRIKSLWQGPSDSCDSTLFELLVGAACARKGRKVEFLVPGGSAPTPDLRCHDLVVPTVIECKRQAQLLAYERSEEDVMRKLFTSLYAIASKKGLWGVFDVRLVVEHTALDAAMVAEAAARQRLAATPGKPTEYNWGSVAYHERSPRMTGPAMRLYSPEFLKAVFGWTSDIPDFDGIVCKVEAQSHMVESVRRPLALRWTNDSEQALQKRSWTSLSLFGDATKQIPPGQAGTIYVCYREGTREVVSDRRTSRIIEQMQDFRHEPDIRIPTCFLVRLYPRALGEGQPDLVESSVALVTRLHGSDSYVSEFPAAVFTIRE
jgi:hypothetical protein